MLRLINDIRATIKRISGYISADFNFKHGRQENDKVQQNQADFNGIQK